VISVAALRVFAEVSRKNAQRSLNLVALPGGLALVFPQTPDSTAMDHWQRVTQTLRQIHRGIKRNRA
jgi:hypothetical protein